MAYYCRKYEGLVSKRKAYSYCLPQGCYHLITWTQRMNRRFPGRKARNAKGECKF